LKPDPERQVKRNNDSDNIAEHIELQ
jgi:hypothetical protein